MSRRGGSWRRILEMPPIDWALLAAERSRSRRHTPAVLAKMKATKAKRRKLRRRLATDQATERQKRTRRGARAVDATGQLLRAMEPGEWYGRPDLRNLTGLKYGSIKALTHTLAQRGWLERAPNGDYAPTVYRKGVRIDLQPRGEDCRWLWRLAPPGEVERARVAFLG